MAIGTAAAILGSSAVGAIGSASAASAQKSAARSQTELAENIYNQQTELFSPYYEGGLNYQNALNYEMFGGDVPNITPSGVSIVEGQRTVPGEYATYGGGRAEGSGYQKPNTMETYYTVGDQEFGDRASAQTHLDGLGSPYQGYQETDAYKFQLNQGMNALEGSAAASGGLFSGQTGKDILGYSQGLASNEYNNYLNRLSVGANSGQASAANQANAAGNYGQTAGNALAQYGNAASAGAIGATNSVQNGLTNWLGYQQYNKTLGALS